jgi:hypothetical protein
MVEWSGRNAFKGLYTDMGMGQNPIPLVNIKIASKWMFIPLKMVSIGIDPYPYQENGVRCHKLELC